MGCSRQLFRQKQIPVWEVVTEEGDAVVTRRIEIVAAKVVLVLGELDLLIDEHVHPCGGVIVSVTQTGIMSREKT